MQTNRTFPSGVDRDILSRNSFSSELPAYSDNSFSTLVRGQEVTSK